MSNHINEFKEKGYTIINDVLSPEECDIYKSTVKYLYPKYKDHYATGEGKAKHQLDKKDQEEIIFNLHNKDLSFITLLDHPVAIPLIKELLQEGSYQNNEPVAYLNSAARNTLQGFPAQQLHIDSRFPGSPIPLAIQVFWALDDLTKENGATRIMPGSHKIVSYPENNKKYDNEQHLTCQRGSVLIFNGSVWHGASANTNGADRWVLIFTYGRWFVKPAFDFNRNMPKAYFDKLNDQQKELLGYKFNPSIDEFNRVSARSTEFENPTDYQLPF